MILRGLVLVFALLLGQPSSAGIPGSLLRPGMQLVYSTNGQDQPPWVIDSARADSTLRPGSDCVVIQLRRQPGQAQPELSRLCLAHDTLFTWNAERNEWRPQRPVGPHMVMRFTRTNGDHLRYETADVGEDTIGDLTIPVVLTTVTTSDSAGQPMRRLRERYSIGLATATGGVFESYDSASGGWRTLQEFKLVGLRN